MNLLKTPQTVHLKMGEFKICKLDINKAFKINDKLGKMERKRKPMLFDGGK